MNVTIYHNPRCAKSRETLRLLEERGITPKVVLYLETPPGAAELDRILTLLKLEPRDLMRKKEPEYKQATLDDPKLTRAALIQAMVAQPKLIERPIVIANGQAALGRPPQNILKLL